MVSNEATKYRLTEANVSVGSLGQFMFVFVFFVWGNLTFFSQFHTPKRARAALNRVLRGSSCIIVARALHRRRWIDRLRESVFRTVLGHRWWLRATNG